MASARPTQSINTLTPPSSSHGAHGSWEFAVPIDNENTIPKDKKTYIQSDVNSRPYAYATRQPLSQHNNINGGNKFSQRTNTLDSQRSSRSSSGVDSHEPALLAPARILSRKHSGLSNGSDPDSGLDMYKTNPANRAISHGPQNVTKRGPTSAPKRPSLDVDDSAWIHRDKLAEIESRELEEAGFRVGRHSSRSGTRSSRSTSRHRSDQSAAERYGETGSVDDYGQGYAARDEKRQRRVSPIPAEEEYEEVYEEPESMNWESRTQEGVAAHQQTPQTRQHVIRPSTSRIPVSKSSPVPVPKPVKDRENPLPRSRNGSGAWGSPESGLPQPRIRSRSTSVSSAVLLDEYDSDPPRTPVRVSTSDDKNRSPQKAKVPGKGAPTVKKTGAKPRQTSGVRSRQTSVTITSTSPTKQRPGTSGGGPRPSTARPDGDPPWIATMYKPDPRLPPDQQMLPTHAKRMMQEQWEREGKTGSMYDREFRLLNAEEFAEPKRSEDRTSMERAKRSEDHEMQWPLPSPRSATSNGRPGTSGTDHGGYKITPTIHSPKAQHAPKAESAKRQVEPVRVQEPPQRNEKEKEKGLCCGCAVM